MVCPNPNISSGKYEHSPIIGGGGVLAILLAVLFSEVRGAT